MIRDLVSDLWGSFVRSTAFLRKDIIDFIKQPRLLLQLVLGPFLILLIFGLGFSSQPINLQTIIVIDKDNDLRPFIEQNADNLAYQLILVDIVESEGYAKHELAKGRIDVVIVVPENTKEKIRSNEQPVFLTYHNIIDPMRRNYIQAFTDVVIDEVNRRTHVVAIEQAQEEMKEIQPRIEEARSNATNLREAMEQGNQTEAQQEISVLHQNLANIQTGSVPSGWLLLGTGGLTSGLESSGENEQENLLAQILMNINALSHMENDELSSKESIERVIQTEEDLAEMEAAIKSFRRTDPIVIASPFRGESMSIAETETEISDFYVPRTIALLLQHLCITLGALSFVRERQTGTMELIKASPLKAIEVLVGKYVAYWVAGALAVSVLTALLLYVLNVPMLGNLMEYVLTLAALMFTSLGFGFLISLVSRSISQAVQFTMITLLASIFFSGFFISLDQFQWYVQFVSWIFPASYGIRLLEDNMLRGLSIELLDIVILTGIGLILFTIAWIGLQRELDVA